MIKNANAAIIEAMKSGCIRFADSIEGIYLSFNRERQEAKKASAPFKEERKIYGEKMRQIRKKHRNMIRASQSQLQESLGESALKLHEELTDSLCKPLPAAFCRLFDAYSNAELRPGKSEIEALATLSEAHPIALRMLDNLCEKTGSQFRVKHPAIELFENDISYLARLGSLCDFPLSKPEQLETAIALFAGTKSKPYKIESQPAKNPKEKPAGDMLIPEASEPGERMRILRSDGSVVDGDYWEAGFLNGAAIDFQALQKHLDDMTERWSSISYPVKTKEELDEEDNPDEETDHEEDSEQKKHLPIENVETDDGIRLAAELGREKAKQAESVIPDSMKQ